MRRQTLPSSLVRQRPFCSPQQYWRAQFFAHAVEPRSTIVSSTHRDAQPATPLLLLLLLLILLIIGQLLSLPHHLFDLLTPMLRVVHPLLCMCLVFSRSGAWSHIGAARGCVGRAPEAVHTTDFLERTWKHPTVGAASMRVIMVSAQGTRHTTTRRQDTHKRVATRRNPNWHTAGEVIETQVRPKWEASNTGRDRMYVGVYDQIASDAHTPLHVSCSKQVPMGLARLSRNPSAVCRWCDGRLRRAHHGREGMADCSKRCLAEFQHDGRDWRNMVVLMFQFIFTTVEHNTSESESCDTLRRMQVFRSKAFFEKQKKPRRIISTPEHGRLQKRIFIDVAQIQRLTVTHPRDEEKVLGPSSPQKTKILKGTDDGFHGLASWSWLLDLKRVLQLNLHTT